MIKTAWLVLLGALLLSGCKTFQPASPTPLPTIVLDSGNESPASPLTTTLTTTLSRGGVTASGIVIPAKEAQMASSLGGSVRSVEVSIGEVVKAGQVLVTLANKEKLAALVESANLDVLAAQKALEDLNRTAALGQAEALQKVAAANREVRDAQYAFDNFLVPSGMADLEPIDAVAAMQEKLAAARKAFEPWMFKSYTDSTRRDLKDRLDQAQSDYDTAVRWLEIEVALSQAKANLDVALKDYEVVKNGPDPDKLNEAQARLKAAQAQLDSNRNDLDNAEIKAPFDGTVGKLDVQVGDWVTAGQQILVLADLEHLQVETTDLSERDVPRVTIGQPVTVTVSALGQQVSGHVIEISPLADTLGGDVVYKTTIALDSNPEGLRAGMSVDIQFGE